MSRYTGKKCYWDVGLDRCFYELKWIILCLAIRGGPVTERRIYSYCIAHYNIHRFFVRYVIRQALRRGIITYVEISNSYTLIPPPRKMIQQKLPSKELPEAGVVTRVLQFVQRFFRFLGSCFSR